MDDLIRRWDAIDIATQYCPDDDGSCSKADRDIRELLDDLENLPSAEPERKNGKWIRETFEDWWCNQCGNEICTETPENYHYCPNCGADMRGAQDEHNH